MNTLYNDLIGLLSKPISEQEQLLAEIPQYLNIEQYLDSVELQTCLHYLAAIESSTLIRGYAEIIWNAQHPEKLLRSILSAELEDRWFRELVDLDIKLVLQACSEAQFIQLLDSFPTSQWLNFLQSASYSKGLQFLRYCDWEQMPREYAQSFLTDACLALSPGLHHELFQSAQKVYPEMSYHATFVIGRKSSQIDSSLPCWRLDDNKELVCYERKHFTAAQYCQLVIVMHEAHITGELPAAQLTQEALHELGLMRYASYLLPEKIKVLSCFAEYGMSRELQTALAESSQGELQEARDALFSVALRCHSQIAIDALEEYDLITEEMRMQRYAAATSATSVNYCFNAILHAQSPETAEDAYGLSAERWTKEFEEARRRHRILSKVANMSKLQEIDNRSRLQPWTRTWMNEGLFTDDALREIVEAEVDLRYLDLIQHRILPDDPNDLELKLFKILQQLTSDTELMFKVADSEALRRDVLMDLMSSEEDLQQLVNAHTSPRRNARF